MNWRRWIEGTHIVLALFLIVSRLASAAENATPQVGQRIFVCGHSFHVPIAEPLAELGKGAKLTGHELVGKQFIGGSRVSQHWDLPEDQNRAKQALSAGKVDVLTVSPMPFLPDEGIDKFTALALEHNPKCRVLVQASWFPYDSPTPPAGFSNADRDRAKIDELRSAAQPFYEKMTAQANELNGKYKEKAGQQVVYLVPVGHAVLTLREKIAAGQVPGIEKQSTLFRDTLGHGHAPITALAAYCHYCVVYGQSPAGLPTPSLLKNEKESEALNKLLQEISWDTVKSEPLTGVSRN